MLNKMESALDILSRAADMVGNARILKQALKKGSTSPKKQSSNTESGIGNNSDDLAEPPPPLEEPLDMSIKSKKRHPPEDSYNFVKKHRPSVIYFNRAGQTQASSSSDDDQQSNSSEPIHNPKEDSVPKWEQDQSEAPPRRVIITHDVNEDGGLEEHFRRSLSKAYSKEAEAQLDVDAHFSRSLGKDAWKEIQRVASIKKDTSPTPAETLSSVKNYSSPVTSREGKEKDLDHVKGDSITP